jgi:hypothetical protein
MLWLRWTWVRAISLKVVEASAAQTGGVLGRENPWLVTLVEAYGGRLTIEATMEPSSAEGG